jgi:hypothetical protein
MDRTILSDGGLVVPRNCPPDVGNYWTAALLKSLDERIIIYIYEHYKNRIFGSLHKYLRFNPKRVCHGRDVTS